MTGLQFGYVQISWKMTNRTCKVGIFSLPLFSLSKTNNIMERIVKITCERDSYDIRESADYSMSVGQLIELLEHQPKNAKIIFSFDNGYMYGRVKESDFKVVDIETKEEEAERERLELEAEEREMAWFEHISDKICETFDDTEWLGEEETIEKLTEIVGKECDCYDHCIDDCTGEDDEEDKYTMKACFRFANSPITIRMYYGCDTEIIGYVDVSF
jgi:hypothetical protein